MKPLDRPAGLLDRRPIVFVDRDGVINLNRPESVLDWEAFEFLPGALAALAALTEHGFRVIVITNQAAVNRGRLSWTELTGLHARMVEAIERAGGAIEAVLACPHRPDEGCVCRKPAPGLLFQAAERYEVDLAETVLIGDHPSDLEAAWRAGCQSLLVLSGRTAAWTEHYLPPGCRQVLPDLRAAADYLIERAPHVAATADVTVAGPAGAAGVNRPAGDPTGAGA